MRYFLDTEFIEDGRTIDLISIGVVAEDGREFYAESLDADLSKASPWVRENVIPHLWHLQLDKREANEWHRDGGHGGLLTRRHLRSELLDYVAEAGEKPEFWGYYADYDWVAVAQLFGTMMDLPGGWPMLCLDLKQEAIRLGSPNLPAQAEDEHHALADARWNRQIHDVLAGL